MNIFKWFKNKKKPGNEIVYTKEINRDAGQISAIVNVLPSKEIQLFLEFFPKRVNGTTATISLTVQSVDEAKKFIGQIEDSFNCWNADDCEKVIIRA